MFYFSPFRFYNLILCIDTLGRFFLTLNSNLISNLVSFILFILELKFSKKIKGFHGHVHALVHMKLIDNNDIYLAVMLPILAVMLPAIPDMLPVMLPALSPILPAIPVMFSADTTVPIAGTSNTANANAIANDRISVVAIFI
jgi:hypothetical protein